MKSRNLTRELAAGQGPSLPSLPAPEETLVSDVRSGLTLAQLIERRLMSLLQYVQPPVNATGQPHPTAAGQTAQDATRFEVPPGPAGMKGRGKRRKSVTTIHDVRAAYEEGDGQWTGCNWPTHVGRLGLDLDGISADQARSNADRWGELAADEAACDTTAGEETSLVAAALRLHTGGVVIGWAGDREGGPGVCGHAARRFCAEVLAREWEFVSVWLEEIESDARWAGREAREAMTAAEDGDWQTALAHASRARRIESGYHAPQAWRKLRRVLRRAARSLGPFRTG